MGVQLTFYMNSTYDTVFNACRWRRHFGNGVDRLVLSFFSALSNATLNSFPIANPRRFLLDH
jgi:hypothetical protein